MNKENASPVGAMFGRIAGYYDFLNHFLSLGIDRGWRKELVAELPQKSGQRILDLAAGTFDVALAAQKTFADATILAVDFCFPMLSKGKKKLKCQTSCIIPIVGDAKALPFPSESADCVTMAFGIRNIQPRFEAFRQMLRVLKPGGKACILEFGSAREKIWGGVYNIYLQHILPVIGRMVARDPAAYAYLAKTIHDFPSASDLADEMISAGMVRVGFKKLTSGIVCLHWGYAPGPLEEEKADARTAVPRAPVLAHKGR